MEHIFYEFRKLKKTIIYFALAFFVVFIGILVLTSGEIIVWGLHIPILVNGSPALAAKIFLSAKSFLVPEGIPIIALNPMASFIAPIMMAFLVSLLVSFPFGLYLAARFVWPALRNYERRTLLIFIAPSLALFYLGCALAYFIIIPQTFAILYSFSAPMGVEPFFALDDFISSVFFITISVGFSFLLPVFMTALSRIGLAPRGFWMRYWRGAVITAIVFSAIVTPDGSGVTMIFLAGPLLGLYFIGAIAAALGNQKNI